MNKPREFRAGRACAEGAPLAMKRVPATRENEALCNDALNRVILTAFAGRCGPDCGRIWNGRIGTSLKIEIGGGASVAPGSGA